MVIFQAPGGSPGYNQFETLDAAVSFVEQLRNERDVSNARIFALEEVKFEMKPYFKVELQALTTSTGASGSSGPADRPAPEAPRPAPEPAAQRQAPDQPAPSPASAPAAPAAPSAPAPQAPSAPAGAPSQPPSPTAPPQAPSSGPEGDANKDQPARRGLFGR